jgi:hypothetical protein
MTIEQLHAEWMEWVAPLMAGTPKSDLAWMTAKFWMLFVTALIIIFRRQIAKFFI